MFFGHVLRCLEYTQVQVSQIVIILSMSEVEPQVMVDTMQKKIYYYEKQYIVIDLVVFHLKMEQNIMKTGIKSN